MLKLACPPMCRMSHRSRVRGTLLVFNQAWSYCQVWRLRITKPDDHASSFYARIWGRRRCRAGPGLGGFFVNEVLKMTKGEPGCLPQSLRQAARSLVEP